jgi:hypothetical protein
MSLRFRTRDSASNAARIIAEKMSRPDAPSARRSMAVHISSVAPSPMHSLYSLESRKVFYTVDMRRVINAALVSRTGILGISGSGCTLTPFAMVKSTSKSPSLVSNSCALSSESFAAVAARRS